MQTLYKQIFIATSLCCALASAAFAADTKKAASAVASASATAKVELMDINSASKEELATLPGIGDARSDAIIKGRPYKGKDDLLNKKIIPEAAYKGIQDKIIARQKAAK